MRTSLVVICLALLLMVACNDLPAADAKRGGHAAPVVPVADPTATATLIKHGGRRMLSSDDEEEDNPVINHHCFTKMPDGSGARTNRIYCP